MDYLKQILLIMFLSILGEATAETSGVNQFFAYKIAQCEKDEIKKVGDVFCFHGRIPSLIETKEYWNDFTTSKIVVVNSLGGEVESAMKMARYLAREEVTTILHGTCSSSCVNYLLPAARNLYLEKNIMIYGLHWPVTPEFFNFDYRRQCEAWSEKYPKVITNVEKCLKGKNHQEDIHQAFIEEFPTASILWEEFYRLVKESNFHEKANCADGQLRCSYHLHVDRARLKAVNPEAIYFDLGRTNPLKLCLDRGVFFKNVGKDCHYPLPK